MWEIEYSREASNYLLDSGVLVYTVVEAIESLRTSKEGIPPEGCTHLAFNHYLWEVAGHLVTYTRLSVDRKLYVTMIKPQ